MRNILDSLRNITRRPQPDIEDEDNEFVSPWEAHQQGVAPSMGERNQPFDPSLLVDDDGNEFQARGGLSDTNMGEQLIRNRQQQLYGQDLAGQQDAMRRLGGRAVINPISDSHLPGNNFMNLNGLRGIQAMQQNAAAAQGKRMEWDMPLERVNTESDDTRTSLDQVSSRTGQTMLTDAKGKSSNHPAQRALQRLLDSQRNQWSLG